MPERNLGSIRNSFIMISTNNVKPEDLALMPGTSLIKNDCIAGEVMP